MLKILFSFLILVTSTLLFSQTGFYEQLADSALTLTKQQVNYDPTYFDLKYPMGDPPANKGVCTDVIIRNLSKNGSRSSI